VREELEFLRDELVLQFAEGGAVFVHAGLRPGVPLAEQVADDLLWIREEFLLADPGLPWLVVFGHTPYRDGPLFDAPRKVGLDTGCVYGGHLSCLDLTEGLLHQVRKGDRRAKTIDVTRRLEGLAA